MRAAALSNFIGSQRVPLLSPTLPAQSAPHRPRVACNAVMPATAGASRLD